MMEFAALVKQRRSIRRYLDRPISHDLIEQICEAGRWAPSALNMQPWEFVVVTDPEVKRQLSSNAGVMGVKWPHISSAPVVIVICARKTSRFARDDCLLAAQNMMLQAADLGLGTCYIGGFSGERVRQLLQIPSGYTVPTIITVGHPHGQPPVPQKRPLSELLHQDTFEGRGVGLTGYRRALSMLGRLLTERRNKP
jgi:nitroreductase